MITKEDKIVATSTVSVSLWRCSSRTFWTSSRGINFSWKFDVGTILMVLLRFQRSLEKALFFDFVWRRALFTWSIHISSLPKFTEIWKVALKLHWTALYGSSLILLQLGPEFNHVIRQRFPSCAKSFTTFSHNLASKQTNKHRWLKTIPCQLLPAWERECKYNYTRWYFSSYGID